MTGELQQHKHPLRCERVIVVNRDDDVQLAVPGNNRTCVYVNLSYDGLLEITGGASIIKSIEGKDMVNKIIQPNLLTAQTEPKIKNIIAELECKRTDLKSEINKTDESKWIVYSVNEYRRTRIEEIEYALALLQGDKI